MRVLAIASFASLALGCGRVGFDSSSDGGTPLDGVIDDVPANAVTMTFGEGPAAVVNGVTVDTFISNEAGEPTLNNGGSEELRSEQDVSERILLRFDLASLAQSSTVVQAELSIEILQTHPSASWEIHPVLEAWTEGAFDGAPGLANFTQRTLGDNWSTAGCGEPASAGPSLTTLANISTGPFTFDLDVATVQSWVTTPSTNFGMVFYNTFGESLRFASSEHPTESFRPTLTLTYVP